MSSVSPLYRDAHNHKPVSVQSSGLDAITFATLFDGGVQQKCPASIIGKCRGAFPLAASAHHCFTCGLSIHCAMICGAEFDVWYIENIKIGLNLSMLPPFGQSKLLEYDGIPPSGQAICAYCIKSLEAKIGMKQPNNKHELRISTLS